MQYLFLTILVLLIAVCVYGWTRLRKAKAEISALRAAARQLEDEKNEKTGEYRAELVNDLIERYENEILKMGADIHDDLIQKLTVYRLHVDKLERVESILEMQLIADQMKTDFKIIVDSVRRITKRLIPETEIGSFTGMMRELCRREEIPGVAFIRFKSEGAEKEINSTHQPHLLRIVQELINNATKHTVAWHIEVNLHWRHDVLEIEVEDDGRRFETLAEKMNKPGTFATLRMRTSKIGASINFSEGLHGTKATVLFGYGRHVGDETFSRQIIPLRKP